MNAESADSAAVLDRFRSHRMDSFDELIEGGRVRPRWQPLVDRYRELGPTGLAAADQRVRMLLDDDGITYNAADGDSTQRRRWELDCVPLVVDGDWWAGVERGVEQRARLFDALLADIYADQRMISAGVLPPELVYGHPGYLRRAARLPQHHPHALFLHACDIGRARDGEPTVYADWTQAPSGIGYAVADRRLMTRAFPRLLLESVPRPLTAFAANLRLALFDYAPRGVADPVVAVLTPGALSETAFDQAYLASLLGVPLVEAADLVVRDGAVYMRSLGKFKRLDVILRRVDADYADPLDLRADSRLGVTGLVEAVARGTVTVVNTLGSGVLENPALVAYLPVLCRSLLDEELLLASVPTRWGGVDRTRAAILGELSTATITNFRTGERFYGPALTAAQLADLHARIDATGWQWVAQAQPELSVGPSTTGARSAADVALRAAPVAMRAFSVARGSGYAVMPGGLGHVLTDDPVDGPTTAIAAKDVWVLAGESSAAADGTARRVQESRGDDTASSIESLAGETIFASSPRVLSDLFWIGRYGERAESTTRMVKVARERYEDLRYRPWMGRATSVPMFVDALLEVTGAGSGDRFSDREGTSADLAAILRAVTCDRATSGSVAYAVDRLSQVARAVRDQLSTSTWMVLGAINRALAQVSAAGADPDGVALGRGHDDVLRGLLALTGVQAESMVRDPGWLFMDIGRRVERAQVLAELTTAALADQHEADAEQGLMDAYLVANESAIIYRRRNRGILRFAEVVAVMMFDEANPRSMIYQLATLRADLNGLPDELRSAAGERVVEDLIAALRRVDPADLAAVDADGHRAELADLMRTLAAGVREIADVLARTRFAYPVQTQPLWGAGEESA